MIEPIFSLIHKYSRNLMMSRYGARVCSGIRCPRKKKHLEFRQLPLLLHLRQVLAYFSPIICHRRRKWPSISEFVFICGLIVVVKCSVVNSANITARGGARGDCEADEFECLCYEPRCVSARAIRDGVADCHDASDELDSEALAASAGSIDQVCGDGTPSRRLAADLRGARIRLCRKNAGRTCPTYLNQICIEVDNRPRCVCKPEFFRMPNSQNRGHFAGGACFPIKTFRSFGFIGDQNKPFNCTQLLNDLMDAYPDLFHLVKRVTETEPTTTNRPSTINTSHQPKIHGAPNLHDPHIALNIDPIRSKDHREKYQSENSSDPKADEGAIKSECDPNHRFSCNESGKVCARISQQDNSTMSIGKCVEINECSDRSLNNCDKNARCIDNDLSYECLCREGYIDASDQPARFPGRRCRKLVNECLSPQLNDCDRNADCVDQAVGFTCRCQDGFRDDFSAPSAVRRGRQQRPGRKCVRDEENCKSGKTECDKNADCVELAGGSYRCECRHGFFDTSPNPAKNPGRVCSQMQLDCDPVKCDPAVAQCIFTVTGAVCQCRRGFVDMAPETPGRHCRPVLGANPCQDYSLHDCDAVAECNSDTPGYFQCRCPKGFVDISPDRVKAPGRKCKKEENECELGTHECDANAECINTPESYHCRCKPGWADVSANTVVAPGRSCKKTDLCKTANCAPEAECREGANGAECQCTTGYADVSRQHGKQAGQVCRPTVDECAEKKHDCAQDAHCIDTAEGFICRCNDGYRDDSQNPQDRPGRVCTKAIPEAPECDVNDPMSCSKEKHEVCLFRDGNYKCACPNAYSRLPDGRCLAINECLNGRLNNCSSDADCIDQAEGYMCRCRSGFADVSGDGRICQRRVNECAQNGGDCHKNAVCIDTEKSYTCRCLPGFADVSEVYNQLPGRKCVEATNECLDRSMHECSDDAICEDAKEGYICSCRNGFVDASADPKRYPGRVCNKLSENNKVIGEASHDSCDPHNSAACGPNSVCQENADAKDEFTCQCASGAVRYYDGQCHQVAACKSDSDCDKNAICANVFNSFVCQCRPGYYDVSPDAETRPGRVCKELVNECANNQHNCSPFAECIDANDGYACVCSENFVDTSSQYGLPPGRKCSNVNNECADKSLNSCDENADCIDTPDNYTCKCFAGYVDVSSNAHLPPGRVCTVQTTCPKQKTDLMFLIDGSGSIGSYVFKNEVLRFVRDFLELFDVGLDNTRVGLIQYSDQIRHEFDLKHHSDKQSLLKTLSETQYLTGLTRTGAAIQHMVMEGFSERRGARPISGDVSRVAIVITDGRSQDNVTEPARAARDQKVNMFAIGVTDHVLASELESIAGSPNRWFYVDRFKDLDMRLRSLIQKLACPAPERPLRPSGVCNPDAQTGCDRTRNEICVVDADGKPKCQCPNKFQRHPITHICGGDLCNPEVPTSCQYPDTCEPTPFGNHRCVCPESYARNQRTGVCLSTTDQQQPIEKCRAGMELNPRTGKCVVPGSCDPTEKTPCDVRKREKCLLHLSGRYHTCQCGPGENRHPATEICLVNECLTGENDCAHAAKCVDTDSGYLCVCPPDTIDSSLDKENRPGRVCVFQANECLNGAHHCSPDAICADTPEGYICRCKTGFVDFSPNPHKEPGIVCQPEVDECANPQLNTCHRDALCIDTVDSYKCICKAGFTDLDELRNPGRQCQRVETNDRCDTGKNDCDKNARCVQRAGNDFTCICPPGYRDQSADKVNKPGRVCIPLIPECDNPSLNDCDAPDRAICTDTDEGYLCRCRQGFLDISPNPAVKPGRLCKPLVNECVKRTHDCAPVGGICEDTPDSYTCRCAINHLDVSPDKVNRPGRNCKRLINECINGQNDCAGAAICTDTEDSYTCACPAKGYIDQSPDLKNKPGRVCIPTIDECARGLHECSPNADCEDTPDSYHCRCREDFVDESPDSVRRPGLVCRPALIDECALGKHDCHEDAVCLDLPHGFACQCGAAFFDASPHRVTHPGRVCVARPTPPPEECRLDVSSSCKLALNEVCRIIGGIPKCACPANYGRNRKTNACTMINECQFPQLNDCHPSAECTDLEEGFTCRCREGYRDTSPDPRNQSGRRCQPLINECQFPHLNDCNQNAHCNDTLDGYECRCRSGFKDLSPEEPGRICQRLVDECSRRELNSCDQNADCHDTEDSYSCQCRDGFLDVSPSMALPGRGCKQIVNECANPKLNDCDKSATCHDTVESYTCECPFNSRDISITPAFPGRVCLVFENECETGRHDCDANAKCHDNEQSFTCECPAGYTDRSPNKLKRPGRVCVKLVDECATKRHTCSAQAECRDLEEGYTCECKDGYVDRSPNLATQPGRVCGTPETCPSNHECSSAAVCEPLGGGDYKCTCIQGYVDQSFEGTQSGRICVRNNACRDPRLNNCSRNAVCYDEPQAGSYRCECARGFIDKSPAGTLRGRVCEPPSAPQHEPPKKHPCQDPNLNNCHASGTCRATGSLTYTCECPAGYADRSPDVRRRPGRICVQTEPICLDSSRNDCHSAAICSESKTNEDGYTCRCRDGYVDQSPNRALRPGRICVEQVNECLDRSLNDCHALAVCEDLQESYTCRCPLNTIDESPDPRHRPGRKCHALVNECTNSALNICSRFADCIDQPRGYACKCRAGYHDANPANPGTECHYIINECEAPNLNDCHRNAECIDLPGGYDCKCKAPYVDEGPANQHGRVCLYNECKDPKANNCDKNAECLDTEDGYLCRCKDGFFDESPHKQDQGRICIEYKVDQPQQTVQKEPENPDLIPCGFTKCKVSLNEVCEGGNRCVCRPGEGRASNLQKCQLIEKVPLAVRVVSRDGQPLSYSSDYGNSRHGAYVEFANQFEGDLGRAIGGTVYAPRYVNTEVAYITHPKTINSSWPDGLLVNFTVGLSPTKTSVDRCDLWKKLIESLQRSNNAIGGGKLNAAADVDLLDPCAAPQPKGETCGGIVCNADLGEVCLGERLCGCANGEKRASSKDHCRPVESWQIPLWVIRKNQVHLVYNETFANPQDDLNKQYVKSFEDGVAECYPHTELKNAFVAAEVNDISDPMSVNASWDTGLLFNSTVHFRKGSVRIPSDAYYQLVRYIMDNNNYQVGHSGLYLNPYQPDPFKACYKNNCHPKGVCIDLGPNAYRCECSNGYRDMNPADPGRNCLPTENYNECEKKEDNVCSENARCIDLEYLYKCECVNGYSDASPKGAVPGSVCVLDYCSDVNFCTINSTCVNTEHQAECQCKQGFVDIRKSERRLAIGMNPDAYCLNRADVDWCLLGLHNCSAIAQCTNQRGGYTCACPAGYVDGNPSLPGRVCAALLCDMCNQHGDCVHNPLTNNVTCACTEGYTGEFCEVAPSSAPLYLLIFLAILFLLLTLCCLLYLCTKCHCFKRQAHAFPWNTLDQSASSDSGADFGSDMYIPRAKLRPTENSDANAQQLAHYLDEGLRIPRAHLHDTSSIGSGSSEFTIREEIERRVITDVTKTELRTTTTDEQVHNDFNETVTSSAMHSSNAADGGSAATAAAHHYDHFRAGSQFEEQERGESVAEFANSRSGGAFSHHQGASSSSFGGGGHHTHQYSTEHQDDRSIGGFATSAHEEDGGVYDKSVAMNRHHELDPATGVERFKSEMTTTKNYSETFHK